MTAHAIALIDFIQEAIEAVGLEPEQISAALDWLKAPTTPAALCREMALNPDEADVLITLYDGRITTTEGGPR